MSNPSDPGQGGQQPDDGSRQGQPDGGQAAPQPGGPYQYQPGQHPQQGPYGQPGGYPPPGQYGPQQGQYGTYQPPAHGQPYGDRGGYVYSPYGSQPGTPYPAGLSEGDTEPVPRPGIMTVGLILLLLSAVLPIIGALAVVAAPGQYLAALGTPEQLDQLRAEGVAPETVIAVVGAIVLVIALLFVLFAWLAFSGRNWARIVLAIMTVGFVLISLVGVGQLAGAQLLLMVLVLGAAIAGTVIFFLPGPGRYFAAPRR